MQLQKTFEGQVVYVVNPVYGEGHEVVRCTPEQASGEAFGHIHLAEGSALEVARGVVDKDIGELLARVVALGERKDSIVVVDYDEEKHGCPPW